MDAGDARCATLPSPTEHHAPKGDGHCKAAAETGRRRRTARTATSQSDMTNGHYSKEEVDSKKHDAECINSALRREAVAHQILADQEGLAQHLLHRLDEGGV